MNYEIIKYINDDKEIEVYISIEEETVWLSQEQISILFNKSRSTISKHINKIYEEGVLNKEGTCAKNAHMPPKCERFYDFELYNLDVILMVGARTKSKIINSFYSWCKDVINELKFRSDNHNLVRFNENDISLDVKVNPKEETVYLTQNQIAILFDTTQQNVSLHIKNIIDDGELSMEATHKEYLLVQTEGNREVRREIDLYNLDMILSIGYRVKSKTAITFRKWANSVLKEYLLKGYVINENRTLVTNENYINLINRVDSIENRLKMVEQKEKHLFIEDKIIFEDKLFDALILINQIVDIAHKSLILIDPYIDISTLNAFKNKQKEVTLTFITSSKSTYLSNEDISRFINEYGNLIIKVDDSYHDRYLIIDNEVFYHLGSSINYLGKRFSQITLIKDLDIIETLKRRL